MDKLASGNITGSPVVVNTTNSTAHGNDYHPMLKAAAGDYWLPTLAPLGKVRAITYPSVILKPSDNLILCSNHLLVTVTPSIVM
jgi:hypothetical protein